MLPRWITFAYLVYLALPMALLFIGSFGDLWLNSLLPTGVTLKWYLQVAADPSFRRAFTASLFVAVMTSIMCVAIGVLLAYAVFRAHDQRVRAAARVLYQLPVALPALVGTQLHILPLQLYSLISESGTDFPAAAALALMITAACAVIMTTGEWFGSLHERHL